ncbi:hypothetical protein [Caulobacter radicis]|uniref:Uncharacterized protein n=1 Tax=Caulobacter radicis TaxID=2172650 RepID=A0A2T9JFR8_9CAUL|nr:hypothetical protein [Caulobacter radicis]PVM82532.1 hypothetical protein DDF65_12095 [Caulobacter radicis]
MKSWLIAVAAAVAGLAGAAHAGTPYPVKMKCPVGGESFVYTDTMSYSTWGQRPDGKPYGSWEFPRPIPTCPGNGLAVYKSFSKAELKALPALLASDDYRRMVQEDTSYYRAAWLERALKGEGDPLWLVLQASWQSDADPARKARYQRAFIAGAEALPAKPDDLQWLGIMAKVVNARRELGEFDAAKADLARLDVDKQLAALPAPPAEGQEPEAVANRRGILNFLKKLGAAVDRGDASAEPIDMIPPMAAAHQCVDLEAKGKSHEVCKSERVAKFLESMREAGKSRDAAGS